MSRKLAVILPEKNDAFTRIKKFMSSEESGVTLSATEEKMLLRFMMANSLLAERKFTRDQIAEKIKEGFGVSIHTARADINNAYSLFVTVTEDYRRYTLFHHIEFIDQQILKASTDKSLVHLLPKLLDAKTKAVMAMPVEMQAPNVPAPVIIVNVTADIKQSMPISEIIAAADKMIQFEKDHEYVEFTEEKDEPKD